MPSRAARPKTAQSSTPTAVGPTLSASDEIPPQLFVLPNTCSSEARFVSLRNPATESLTRYLYCPRSGFHELTRISQPVSTPTSCLLAHYSSEDEGFFAHDLSKDVDVQTEPLAGGYVIKDAHLLPATLIDPIFLLLPVFPAPIPDPPQESRSLARTADDHLDDLSSNSVHMAQLLRQSSVRRIMASHLERICEHEDLAGESVYRLDITRFLSGLIARAENTVAKAWPRSLEDHIQKQLEMPITLQTMKSQASCANATEPNQSSNPEAPEADRSVTNEDTQGTTILEPSNKDAPTETLKHKLRLRTALSFILTSYVSSEWRRYFEHPTIMDRVYDFGDLNARLELVKKAKAEIQASRSFTDNISRKRSNVDDAEAEEARAEKKRKKEDEEKKRKAESRATRDLKKVNTIGMKKMSSFFTTQQPKAVG